jgi:photosystem II stability/assembly factor-like uncharacterized protein
MFNPYLEVRDGKKFYRSSMNARKNLINIINRILYNDMVFFDLDTPPFPITTPYPQGRTFEYYIENAGEYEFILPRDFNMDGGSVYVYDLDGNIQVRDEYTKEMHDAYVNNTGSFAFTPEMATGYYRVEKVKTNGNVYNKIVFPRSIAPSQQDPIRYSTLFVTSREYYDYTVNDFVERDELLFNGNFVKGMKVLVTNSVITDGFWTLWRCKVDPSTIDPDNPVSETVWELLEVQTYNLRDFIEEIDWWKAGYNPSTPITSYYDTTAHRNSALPTPTNGDVVKIYDDGYGKWMITVWTGTTWEVVGRERYVKRLRSKFYDPSRTIFAGPTYIDFSFGDKWDTKEKSQIWKDIKNRDGSWELKILLDNLNGRLENSGLDYIFDIKQANQVFFAIVNFAHTEQYMIDWAFKTSFLYLGGYNEPLLPIPVQTVDQSESLQSYVEEVKPYHVKLRDFVRRLSPPIDIGRFYVTDFDKPPYYDRDLAAGLPSNDKSFAYRPLRVKPNGDGTYTINPDDKLILENDYWPVNIPINESGKQYWNDWLYNFGKNPNQPDGLIADPLLIRRLKTSIAFDRVEEYLEEELGNEQDSNPNKRKRTRVRAGWGGSTKVIGWDLVPWDMESDYVSSAGRLDANIIQYPGMPKNDPATLIPGIDYRGTKIDAYTFQYGQKEVEIKSEPYFVVNTETGQVEVIPVISSETPTVYYGQGTPEYYVTKPANREAYKIVVYLYRQQYSTELNMIIVCGDYGIVEPNNHITITIQGLPGEARIGHKDDEDDNYILTNGTFTATFEWDNNNVDGVVIENIGNASTLRFTASNVMNINGWKFISSDGNYAYISLSGTVNLSKKTSRIWKEDNADKYDLEIDGRQMDQAQRSYDEGKDEAFAYDIDIDGNEFLNPLFEEGHPPELVKVRTNDPFVMSVYQKFSPGSPMIYSQRTFGGYGYNSSTNRWGPYSIGQDAQNIEAVMVHINGTYQRLYEDYIVDVAKREVWFNDNSNGLINPASSSDIIQITSFSVGGGTPFQVAEYEGDRQTSHFKIPNDGQQINKRVHAYMEKTNDLMISQSGISPWNIRNTTFSEKLYSVAYGNGVYVAIGEKVKSVEITSFKKTNNASTNATIITAQEHNLRIGMKIKINGANPEIYNGIYTVESVQNNKKFIISNPLWTNITSPYGIITMDSQARIITSSETIFWTARIADVDDDLKKVIFDGRTDSGFQKCFVAVGKKGVIITSDDGITWTNRVSTVNTDINDVTFITETNTWVAIGQGAILKSLDNARTWSNTITQVKMTVGVNIPLTGPISAEDDIHSFITYPSFLTSIGVIDPSNHTGLSMGAYMDLNYVDINGNPIDPTDNQPYRWEVDKIYVRNSGVDGLVGDWKFIISGGDGRRSVFRVSVGIDGTIHGNAIQIKDTDGSTITVKEILSENIIDRGSYSVKPYELAFNISGNALAELGLVSGHHINTIGSITNPTVSAGKKLKIGNTTMTFSSGDDLDGIIEVINRKTAKHNVIASKINNRLKLTIPAIWEVIPDVANTLPIGASFILTFRPHGIQLPKIDSLLQNMLVWNNEDTVLLNGQNDTMHNGVYTFIRGGAGSEYTFNLNSRPSILYDKNDGMGYVQQGDGTYMQMFFNMNAMKYINGTLFIVGARGTIIATTDLDTWTIIEPADNLAHDLKMIDARSETFMAIGDYGYIIKSQDGFNWAVIKPFTKLSLNDVCVFDDGKWIIVGEKGSSFRSNDNGLTWTQDELDIKTDILSTQYINNILINTFVGLKKLYKLNGPYDGIIPSDYAIVGEEVVFDPLQAPLLPYGHKLRLVNIGTIIQGIKTFKTVEQTSSSINIPVYIVSGHPIDDQITFDETNTTQYNQLKKSIFVTLNGEIISNTGFEYKLSYDSKKNKITELTLNGDISSKLDLVVALFNGEDICAVQTDTYNKVIKNNSTVENPVNITYVNTGKSWTSGWTFTEHKLSQVPGSKFPREGTIIVKKNGIELMPPDYEFYIGDGDTTNFPLSPPVNRSAKFEVYVNGIQKIIGMSSNSHCYLVNDYNTNKVIEIAFRNAPLVGDDIVIVIYENHEYVVNYNSNTQEARLIIVEKKPITSSFVMVEEDNLFLYKFKFPSYVNHLNHTITVKVNNNIIPNSIYKLTYFSGLVNGIELIRQPDSKNGLSLNDILTITATPDHSVTIKDGDEFSVVSFKEDAAMTINTELFNGATDSNFYILKKRPYNTNSVMVTVNGIEQIHMNDYRLTLLILGGWDTFVWGGKEQYGKYNSWVTNPDYIEYLNAGGNTPIRPAMYELRKVVDSNGNYIFDTITGDNITQEVVVSTASVILAGPPTIGSIIGTDAEILNKSKSYIVWTKNTIYRPDVIVYNIKTNSYYKCLIGHNSGFGFDTTKWELINQYIGIKPLFYTPWKKNHNYINGDVVYNIITNSYYITKTNHNSGLVFDTSNWIKYEEYSGPMIYSNPSTIIKHGPDIEAYSWDSEYEGAVVEFDVAHTESDRIKVTTFGGQPYRPPFAWRVFRNGHEQWEGIRIADVHKTYLIQDLKITNYKISYEDYLIDKTILPEIRHEKNYDDYEYQYGQVIRLRVNHNVLEHSIPHTVLPTPNREANIPGVIWIKGERIEYYDIKNTYKIYSVMSIADRDMIAINVNEVVKVNTFNVTTPTYIITDFSELDGLTSTGSSFINGETVKIINLNCYYEWSSVSNKWNKMEPSIVTYYKKNITDWEEIDKEQIKFNYLRDDNGKRIIELRTLRRGSQGTAYGVPQKIEHMEIIPGTKLEINGELQNSIPGLNNFEINQNYKEVFICVDDIQMYEYQAWYDRFYPNVLDDGIIFYEIINNKIVFKTEIIQDNNRVIVEHDMTSNNKIKIIGVILDFKFTTTTHETGVLVIDGSYQQQLPSFRPNTELKKGGLAHSNQESVRFLTSKPGSYN